FSSRRRHTRFSRDWSSDVCSSDLLGLGRTHAGLYATDESLAAALQAAGEVSGERTWRLPLEDSYRHALDSAVADISHQARDPHRSEERRVGKEWRARWPD